MTIPSSSFPPFGYLGLALVAICWPLNWLLPGLRTHWAFFPLWLGYILAVEGWCAYRQGRSLLTRNPRGFAWLFLLSAPTWWLFELFNARVQYWLYTPVDSFSAFEYYAYCTLNFSVVLPAVFSTAELFLSFQWLKGRGPHAGKNPATLRLFFAAGWAMLALALWRPEYGMAFLWMSLFFILDPLNYWLGRPSLLRQTARGDWRLVYALFLGGLACGFFWEMWNMYSSPRWEYRVPYVDFWYVFEMPLAGYLGYLPFALELYALNAVVMGRGGLFPGGLDD